MKPQETELYKTFYNILSFLSDEELHDNWWIQSQHDCQEYGNVNDADYIIICVCEDLFQKRKCYTDIFEKQKGFCK